MHELAIAESVVSSVLERTDGRDVSVVRLCVGQLAGVVPDALTFCFDLAAAGTPLAGATLEIEEKPAGRTAGPAVRTSRSPTRSCCATAAAPTSSCCRVASSLVTSVEVA